MASFSTQPPQKPALQQLGVEPIGLCPEDWATPGEHEHDRGLNSAAEVETVETATFCRSIDQMP
jgi:hypothetical protein